MAKIALAIFLSFAMLGTSCLMDNFQEPQKQEENVDYSHIGYPFFTQPEVVIGYTHIRPDGNRFISGKGSLPDSGHIDIPLKGRPQWVVAVPYENTSIWAVVLDNGDVETFEVDANNVSSIPIIPDKIPISMPPLLVVSEGIPGILDPFISTATKITHPVILKSSGTVVFIDKNGELVFWKDAQITRLDVDALPDARLLMDENERLLVLTGPTSRYRHGVLGDSLEASGFALVDTKPQPVINMRVELKEKVIESIAPIWTDIDGNGEREIIVTASDALKGAQIIVFDEKGEQIASGPAIGRGNRWRHQIAVAPFGQGAELELVDVLTPHIGGVVEFYRLRGDRMEIVAQIKGYTSHTIGSRNLDMAAAGDFDGDGRVELLVPDQGLTELGGIRRTGSGAEVVWTVEADGKISTNIAGVTFADGRMDVGVGREDGVLRIWTA